MRYNSGTTPTRYQYTGQYSHTAEFGLYFYNARWYDPALGRFAQADSIVPGAGNSQAYDRYAYASNNPLHYADSSGHFPWPIIMGLVAAVVAIPVAIGIDIFFNTPPTKRPFAPPPEKRNLTNWVVDRINQDTTAPVTQALRDKLQSPNPINKAGALKAWVGLVQEGAAWDYKKEIRLSRLVEANPNIKLGNTTTNYQAVANVTYGIMAAHIGIPQRLAEVGAGLAQIKDNWNSSQPLDFSGVGKSDTYFDDPFDNYWIKFGYSFQEQYGSRFGSLTPSDLTTAIDEYIAKNGEPPKPLKPGN